MKYSIFVLCLVIVLISCSEKETCDCFAHNPYTVVLGHVCGWCAGADSLYITAEQLTYTSLDYCNDTILNQHRPYSFNELNHLMGLIEIDDFLNISINTCYVCVDGCDTWITISNDTLSHTIRFGYRDSLVVQSIQPFIDALHDLQAEFLDEQ